MTLFLMSFAVVMLAFAGLCAGALLGRAPLRTGCGGDPVVQACPVCRPRQTSRTTGTGVRP